MKIPATRTEHQIHWQQQITHWQQSGLSQAAFCDAHDLVYHQFTYWRRKLTAQNPASGRPCAFVTVQRADDSKAGLTLTLPSGIQIQGLTLHNLTLLPPLLAHLP